MIRNISYFKIISVHFYIYVGQMRTLYALHERFLKLDIRLPIVK